MLISQVIYERVEGEKGKGGWQLVLKVVLLRMMVVLVVVFVLVV